MKFVYVLEGFVLLILLKHIEPWNFCYSDKEEKMCGDKRHVVCYKEDIPTSGNFLDEAPMTYRLMDTLLNKINNIRNDIAGGLQRENDTSFPPAAHMREVIWDNELEFFAIHRSNTCSVERSACSATPKYKQAGELNGMYGQDTKPISFNVAFQHIFDNVLNQAQGIADKSILGKDYTAELATSAPDLSVLANDKASRVGCGIVLCTNCTDPAGNKQAYCYSFTCAFDVVNIEGCPVYKTSEVVSATECKKAFGAKPSKQYQNLCENDGTYHEDVKCYGPPAAEAEGAAAAGPDDSFWGNWVSGEIPTDIKTSRVQTIEPDIGADFPRVELPKIPHRYFYARDLAMEPLPTDNPDKICTEMKGQEYSKPTLKYCVGVENKSMLKHIACQFPYFNVTGKVNALHWSGRYERQLLLELHNRMRDYVASGNEFSSRAKAKYPSASRMREVIWDDELEWLAMWQVKHCAFAHDKCRGTKIFPLMGQNLGFLGASKPNGLPYIAFTIMKNFYIEKNNVSDPVTLASWYNKEINLDQENAGHFSQIIVDKVSRIGCAFSHCESYVLESKATHTLSLNEGTANLMACHYDAMNMYNFTLYKVGPPTSNCKEYNLGVSSTYKNLCAASNVREPQQYDKVSPFAEETSDEEEVRVTLFKRNCQAFGFSDCP